MRTCIFLLLLIPIVSSSQSLSISGNSEQSNGKDLLTVGNGEYELAKYQGRESSVSLLYYQTVPLPIGVYTLVFGATYATAETSYDFSTTNPVYANYHYTNESIIPYLSLRYRILNIPNLFSAYAAVGTQVYMSELKYTYEDDVFEASEFTYNYMLPFFSMGVTLKTVLFNVEPFISYQIDPIYFDDISDIDASDLEGAVSEAGIVTGVRFNIGF